jgi:hypothetical protein
LPCLDYVLTPNRVAAQWPLLNATVPMLCSGLLLLLGMAALSLAQARRHRYWPMLSAVPMAALRWVGAAVLSAELLLCWQVEGGSRAWVTWAGGLTLAALCITGLHTLWQLRRQR